MAVELNRSGHGIEADPSDRVSGHDVAERDGRQPDADPIAVRRHAADAHRCAPGRPNDELVNGCLDGELEAWNELVTKYERLVYAIPLREGLSADDAAEISQAAFETLVQSLHRIERPERLGHWLMTVTRRLTWRRREASRAEISIGIEPVDQRTAVTDDAWERTVDVYEAVAGLGEPCRSLILGLFFDPAEPSYDDLAHGLGMAVGSIGPLRGRCLARLRAMFEDDAA